MNARLSIAWITLVGATFLSCSLSLGWIGLREGEAAGILAIAMVKVHVVGSEFMELRTAPRALRWGFDAWLAVLLSLLLGSLFRII